jgi:hypothetical protein
MQRESILYKQLSSAVQARLNCEKSMSTHAEWFDRHTETIQQLVRDLLPSGSGWDSGTRIDLSESHADKLVFYGTFHHMHESGMYDGWTEHKVIVTPSLSFGIHLRITGSNRNEIKDYLHETFDCALRTAIVWNEKDSRWMDGLRETK